MKSIILAGVALLSFATIGGAAVAQDAAAPTSQPPGDAMAPGDAMSAPADPTPPPSDPSATPPAAPVPPAGSSASPGANPENPGMAGSDSASGTGSMKEYPTCSRTVQDSCINRGETSKKRKR